MKIEKDHVHWFINQIVEYNQTLKQLRGFELGGLQDGCNPLDHSREAIDVTSKPFKLLMDVFHETTGGNSILNPKTKPDEQTGDTYKTGSLLMDFKGLYHYCLHRHKRLGIKKAKDYI